MKERTHIIAIFVLIALLFLIRQYEAFPQSKISPAFIGNSRADGVWYATNISGANAGIKIKAAIDSLPASGGIVYAWFNGPEVEVVTTNFFEGVTKPVTVYLGTATFVFSDTLVIPNKCSVIMSGRGDSSVAGTVIKAAAGYQTGAPLVYLGGYSTAFSSRIENGTIDCSGIAGSIGVLMTHTQEQSGLDHVLVTGWKQYGVYVNSPSTTCQNSYIRDCEIYADADCDSTVATGIWSRGAYNLTVDKVTVNTNNGAQGFVGFKVDGTPGMFSNMHFERYTTGILLGENTAVDNLALLAISGHTSNTVNTLIKISPNTSSQNIALISINKGASTNLLVDSIGMPTIPFTATALGFYFLGNGSGASKTRFHSDASIFKAIQGQLAVGAANTAEILQIVRADSTTGNGVQLVGYLNAIGGSARYGALSFRIRDNSSDTTHDGAIDFFVAKNGVNTLVATIDSSGLVLPEGTGITVGGEPFVGGGGVDSTVDLVDFQLLDRGLRNGDVMKFWGDLWHNASDDTLANKFADTTGQSGVSGLAMLAFDPDSNKYYPVDVPDYTPPSVSGPHKLVATTTGVTAIRDTIDFVVSLTGETASLAITDEFTFPMTTAFKLIQVYAFATTAGTGTTSTIDVLEDEVSIFGITPLTINASANFSTNQYDLTESVLTIADNDLARFAKIKIDCLTAGTAVKGVKLIFKGYIP